MDSNSSTPARSFNSNTILSEEKDKGSSWREIIASSKTMLKAAEAKIIRKGIKSGRDDVRSDEDEKVEIEKLHKSASSLLTAAFHHGKIDETKYRKYLHKLEEYLHTTPCSVTDEPNSRQSSSQTQASSAPSTQPAVQRNEAQKKKNENDQQKKKKTIEESSTSNKYLSRFSQRANEVTTEDDAAEEEQDQEEVAGEDEDKGRADEDEDKDKGMKIKKKKSHVKGASSLSEWLGEFVGGIVEVTAEAVADGLAELLSNL